jgi:hypothetical protein
LTGAAVANFSSSHFSTVAPTISTGVNIQRNQENTSGPESASGHLSTGTPSTKSQPPQLANDNSQGIGRQSEEKFRRPLREARKLKENEQYARACERYEEALINLPKTFKGQMAYSSIARARSSFNNNLWHEAANQYEAAFNRFPRQ